MITPKDVLLAALVLVGAAFVVFWWLAVRQARASADARPSARHLFVGAITNFFDTLGIGSFATTTSIFRLWRTVPDQEIPGTLNVGHALPTVAEALIYITLVEVQFNTLILLIIGAVAGSWIGASIVSSWPRRHIQIGMGFALLAAAVLMVLTALNRFPGGGEELALHGGRLLAAIGINFCLGALMTLGIGLFAPCMIMVSLLGMNPTAAFPIMMGSCAFLMPAASMQFIRKQRYHLRASVGLTLGGVPAVLVAAFIVRSLPLTYVRWLVVVVVIYTSITLLRSARQEPAPATVR